MKKRILDMTCGGRSIWFNKNHPACVYVDRREVEYSKVLGTTPSERHINIHPDLVCDYRKLPFENEYFDLVVFDPPHIVSGTGDDEYWLKKAYGYFETEQEALDSIHDGVKEAMRVLRVGGVLILKWAEISIPTPKVIKAIGYEPLFGHRSGKKSGTNWMTFMKLE